MKKKIVFILLIFLLSFYFCADAQALPDTSPYIYVGDFTISYYCPCDKCTNGLGVTNSGTIPKQGRTCAVNPDIIPLGYTVLIYDADWKLIYILQAEDTGGAPIDSGERIDVYVDNHDTAVQLGLVKGCHVFMVDAKG